MTLQKKKIIEEIEVLSVIQLDDNDRALALLEYLKSLLTKQNLKNYDRVIDMESYGTYRDSILEYTVKSLKRTKTLQNTVMKLIHLITKEPPSNEQLVSDLESPRGREFLKDQEYVLEDVENIRMKLQRGQMSKRDAVKTIEKTVEKNKSRWRDYLGTITSLHTGFRTNYPIAYNIAALTGTIALQAAIQTATAGQVNILMGTLPQVISVMSQNTWVTGSGVVPVGSNM